MTKLLNRSQIKAQEAELLRTAQVSPKGMTALYMGLGILLSVLLYFCKGDGLLSTFFSILAQSVSITLDAGMILYCMGIRRREYMEYTSLFDGFSFALKLILLEIIRFSLVILWGMLFIVPGIMAYFRYRFAVYNLCEDPEISVFEALRMSSRQTYGYKMQLFNLEVSYLGWFILSTLPVIAMESYAFLSTLNFSAYMSAPASLPEVLIQGVWNLVVSMFYLPHFTCVTLAYFDAAAHPAERPDDLGGF